MTYQLGIRSRQRLSGVHPDLVAVVERAIQITQVDFTVLEGLRSRDRQKELVAKGASKTMNSRHLTGHAVDLAPWPIDWNDLSRFKLVADAMKQASEELDVPVIWGGAWSIGPLNKWEGSAASAEESYIKTRRAEGKSPFLDYPHFELWRKDYP